MKKLLIKLLKATAILLTAAVAFEIAHKFGTLERGYEAIGGEIFIPFVIIFAKPILKLFKEPFEIKANKQ